jgi:RNA polymerase sigma-70 factor, ECF subfamily
MPDTTTHEPDEARLVAGLREGASWAFEELVRANAGRMIGTARRILGNDDDARDAVQDAFISAFRARDQFNAEARLSTWLHRIAVNSALMKLRARKRRPEDAIQDFLPRFLPNGAHAEQFASWDEPIEQVLSRKETAARVRAAIGRLPESFRTVLTLRDIEGLSGQEVADLLGISVNAVKLRLHRARMALRTLLSPIFKEAQP